MDKFTADEALDIIQSVNEYALVMSAIFSEILSHKQIPLEICEAQCKIAIEMMRFVLLVDSNTQEDEGDEENE